jgi:hypothetical protein
MSLGVGILSHDVVDTDLRLGGEQKKNPVKRHEAGVEWLAELIRCCGTHRKKAAYMSRSGTTHTNRERKAMDRGRPLER